MTNDEFLGKAIKKLLEDNITVQFNRRKYDSKHAYNFFIGFEEYEGNKSELQINYFSNDPKSWFPVFLHEYSHYLQWKTEKKKWNALDRVFNNYWKAVDSPIKLIKRNTLYKTQELEIDCERKALKLVKKHKLDIDVPKYIKQSNVYILFYWIFWKHNTFDMPSRDEENLYSEYYDLVPDFPVDEKEIRLYDYRLLEDKYLEMKKNK